MILRHSENWKQDLKVKFYNEYKFYLANNFHYSEKTFSKLQENTNLIFQIRNLKKRGHLKNMS